MLAPPPDDARKTPARRRDRLKPPDLRTGDGQVGGDKMRRLALVVLTGALLTACGGNPFSPEGVSGLYNLVSVNGNELPWTSDQGATTFAGSFNLNANNTYSTSVTIQPPSSNIPATVTASGTFELVEPDTIRFTRSDGGMFSGTLDGNRLTLSGMDISVFERN